MAKAVTERAARRDGKNEKGTEPVLVAGGKKPWLAGPLAALAQPQIAQAVQALNRGDVRTARAQLRAVPSSEPEEVRSFARQLDEHFALDLAALGVAAVVFAVIALAALFALFLRRG